MIIYILLIIFFLSLYLIFKFKPRKMFFSPFFSLPRNNFLEPVDAVYTWVDDTDPAWIKEKYKYSTINSFTPIDFPDISLSIRSLRKNAPWIRHIYIVTMRPQKPVLNKKYDVTVIHHDEIWNQQYINDLPTFNPMAIECYLHNIPNLSENFLYLNDDMYISAPIYPSDFTNEKNTYKPYYLKNNDWHWSTNINEDLMYFHNISSTLNSINQKYNISKVPAPLHQAKWLRKNDLKNMWILYYDNMRETSKSRFRKKTNIYPLDLILIDRMVSGNSDKNNITNIYISKNDKNLKKKLNNLLQKQPKLLCINEDSGKQHINKLIRNTLNIIF
jgi:hypothetical protein